jgi:tripeptidyl-peptidase-1
VISAFRPSQETENTVRKWLISSGIPESRITHSENKGWFAFYATAAEAESLLRTEYHEYEDSETGGVMPSCESYHLPAHVREHIDYVSPGIKLLAPVEKQSLKREVVLDERDGNVIEKRNTHGLLTYQTENANCTGESKDDLSTCDVAITPACVAALYQIPPGTSKHPNNTLGIFESELQFYTQLDLNSFFTNFTKQIKNGTHPIGANIDGGLQSIEDPYEAGGEVNLDLMLAYPIVYPQEITLYNVDYFIVQANQNDTYTFGFNTFLDALDGVCSLPSSHNQGILLTKCLVILLLLCLQRNRQRSLSRSSLPRPSNRRLGRPTNVRDLQTRKCDLAFLWRTGIRSPDFVSETTVS